MKTETNEPVLKLMRDRIICLLLLFLMMISLTSCDLLFMPFEYVYYACNYKKDISDDSEQQSPGKNPDNPLKTKEN